jgi:two-component system, NtrC family, response regulator HydG
MDIAAYWKTIADTLQDGLLVVDPEGNIRAANLAASRLTGYSTAELIGKSCRILNCTGCNIIGKGPGENWCGLFSKGEVREKKCLITNLDRRAVHILKSAKVLRDDDGRIVGAVENLTDITDKVRQQQELTRLRQAFQLDDGYCGILGKSPVMQNLFALIENVSQSDAPVIISGQSGTGKELAARAIHETGPRKNKPFIKVNCAALNENVLESELFGHVRGAYTGADRTRIGRFEAAHEGTIFLDEIGDLPLSIQVKLLRVLEEKKIERVGDHRPISVDVRIITATHKNLESLIGKQLFREDLFFRINVFPLHCPSLVERIEDIPIIAQHFIQQSAAKTGKKILGLTPEAMEKLMVYPWPGNIRELRNTIEYAFVLCPSGGIDVRHLPPKLARFAAEDPEASTGKPPAGDAQRERVVYALKQAGQNRAEAARILGVSRVTLWKWMKKYNLDRKADGQATQKPNMNCEP